MFDRIGFGRQWIKVVIVIFVSYSFAAVAEEPKSAERSIKVKERSFEWKLPASARFVGLNAQVGYMDEIINVRGVLPVFQHASRKTIAPRMGLEGTMRYESEAKSGYEVGAIDLSADEFIDGLRVIYMRRTGDILDVKDQYEGRWLGSANTKPMKRLGGNGKPIIGIRGRYDTGLRALEVIQSDNAIK